MHDMHASAALSSVHCGAPLTLAPMLMPPAAAATQLTAMPVCVAGSIVAVLTLAVDHSADPSQSFM